MLLAKKSTIYDIDLLEITSKLQTPRSKDAVLWSFYDIPKKENVKLNDVNSELFFQTPFYNQNLLPHLLASLGESNNILWEKTQLKSTDLDRSMSVVSFCSLDNEKIQLNIAKRIFIPNTSSKELDDVVNDICIHLEESGLSKISSLYISIPVENEQNKFANIEISKKLSYLISKKISNKNVDVQLLTIDGNWLGKLVQTNKIDDWQAFRDEFISDAKTSSDMSFFNLDGSIAITNLSSPLQALLNAKTRKEFADSLFALASIPIYLPNHRNNPQSSKAMDELRFVLVGHSYKINFENATCNLVIEFDKDLNLNKNDLQQIYTNLSGTRARQIKPDGTVEECRFNYDEYSNVLSVNDMSNNNIQVADYLKKQGDVWRLEVEQSPNQWQNKLNVVYLEESQSTNYEKSIVNSSFFNDILVLQDKSGSVYSVMDKVFNVLEPLEKKIASTTTDVFNYDLKTMAGSTLDHDSFTLSIMAWLGNFLEDNSKPLNHQPIAFLITDLGNDRSSINPNSQSAQKSWWFNDFSKCFEKIHNNSPLNFSLIRDEISASWINFMTEKITEKNGRVVVFSHGSLTRANFQRRKLIRELCKKTGGVFVDLLYIGSTVVVKEKIEKKLSELAGEQINISANKWNSLISGEYISIPNTIFRIFVEDSKIKICSSDKTFGLHLSNGYLTDIFMSMVSKFASTSADATIKQKMAQSQEIEDQIVRMQTQISTCKSFYYMKNVFNMLEQTKTKPDFSSDEQLVSFVSELYSNIFNALANDKTNFYHDYAKNLCLEYETYFRSIASDLSNQKNPNFAKSISNLIEISNALKQMSSGQKPEILVGNHPNSTSSQLSNPFFASQLESNWANSDTSSIKDLSLMIEQMLSTPGCNLNVINSKGLTPLYFAVRTANVDLVEKLLQNGADPNLFASNADPLLSATNNFNTDPTIYEKILRLLLENKSNSYNLNKEGLSNPAFLFAVYNGFSIPANIMLEYNQNLLAKSKNGVSLINLAENEKNTELLNQMSFIALVENGYWLNSADLSSMQKHIQPILNSNPTVNANTLRLLNDYFSTQIKYTSNSDSNFAPPYTVLKKGGDCDEKCVLLANTLSQTLSVPIENMYILAIHTTSNSSKSMQHSNHSQLLVQIHDGTFCIMDPISKDGFLVLPSNITDLSLAIKWQTNYYQKIAQLNSTPDNQLKLSSLRAQPICTFALRQIFSSREKYSNQK